MNPALLTADELAVLVATRYAAEPVWIGYLDAGRVWRDTEGRRVDVVAWAAMPAGPAR